MMRKIAMAWRLVSHTRGGGANQTLGPLVITLTSGQGGDAPLGGPAEDEALPNESVPEDEDVGLRQLDVGQRDGVLRDNAQCDYRATTCPAGGT